MFFCYAGLVMVGVIFLLCLWQSLKQWYKGERFQARRAIPAQSDKQNLERLEHECRAYSVACLIAASVAAVVELIAGGIVWGCGG
jgi:hypothetical protein